MRRGKQQRLALIALMITGVALSVALVLLALDDSVSYFHAPTDVVEKGVPEGRYFTLGGLVENGSVVRDGETVRFVITDLRNTIPVTYTGLLPDLFREGQGVVTKGRLGPDGLFTAEEVLAKHDETYMPPEVAEALKASGEWRPDAGGDGAGGDGVPESVSPTPLSTGKVP